MQMSIYTHACFGAIDLQVSKKFYDATLKTLGIDSLGPMGERGFLYGKGKPELVILKPADGKPATGANGGTLSFAAESRAQVYAFHAAALASGGTDAGQPGPHGDPPDGYACYVRDPVGNKISAFWRDVG